MSYNGIMVHPGAENKREEVIIELHASVLSMSAVSGKYEFPLRSLKLSIGGNNKALIFIESDHFPGLLVYTQNKKLLNEPNFLQYPQLIEAITKIKTTRRFNIGTLVAVVAAILMMIGSLFWIKEPLVKRLANAAPPEWEQQMGEQLFAAFKTGLKVINNDSLLKVFTSVAKPILTQAEKEGFIIEVILVEDPSVNAFALPGGKIVMQSGLINKADNWEEVLGVFAHEVAHVTGRHHLRGLINKAGLYLLLSAAIGDVSALAGVVLEGGGQLASLSNSRAYEQEADEQALVYLNKGQINPEGLLTFFRKLEDSTPVDSVVKNLDLSFLSTHPTTDKRIKHLEKLIKKNERTFIPISGSFTSFRETLITQYERRD